MTKIIKYVGSRNLIPFVLEEDEFNSISDVGNKLNQFSGIARAALCLFGNYIDLVDWLKNYLNSSLPLNELNSSIQAENFDEASRRIQNVFCSLTALSEIWGNHHSRGLTKSPPYFFGDSSCKVTLAMRNIAAHSIVIVDMLHTRHSVDSEVKPMIKRTSLESLANSGCLHQRTTNSINEFLVSRVDDKEFDLLEMIDSGLSATCKNIDESFLEEMTRAEWMIDLMQHHLKEYFLIDNSFVQLMGDGSIIETYYSRTCYRITRMMNLSRRLQSDYLGRGVKQVG
jgi:hypothetical protein